MSNKAKGTLIWLCVAAVAIGSGYGTYEIFDAPAESTHHVHIQRQAPAEHEHLTAYERQYRVEEHRDIRFLRAIGNSSAEASNQHAEDHHDKKPYPKSSDGNYWLYFDNHQAPGFHRDDQSQWNINLDVLKNHGVNQNVNRADRKAVKKLIKSNRYESNQPSSEDSQPAQTIAGNER